MWAIAIGALIGFSFGWVVAELDSDDFDDGDFND